MSTEFPADKGAEKVQLVRAFVNAQQGDDVIAIETAYCDVRDAGMSDLDITKTLLILDIQQGNGVFLAPAIGKAFEDIQKRMGKTLES